MSDDLQRFLDGRPILARRISGTERAWRWCRRNPLVAALLGGVAAGVFADPPQAVAACVRTIATVEPDAALVARYAQLRPAFRALYPALRELRGS